MEHFREIEIDREIEKGKKSKGGQWRKEMKYSKNIGKRELEEEQKGQMK